MMDLQVGSPRFVLFCLWFVLLGGFCLVVVVVSRGKGLGFVRWGFFKLWGCFCLSLFYYLNCYCALPR